MLQFESIKGAYWGESDKCAIRIQVATGSYVGELAVEGAHDPEDPMTRKDFTVFYNSSTTELSDVTTAFMRETNQQFSGVRFFRVGGREVVQATILHKRTLKSFFGKRRDNVVV